jgi:DNA-binding transcriptional LysR family regulator
MIQGLRHVRAFLAIARLQSFTRAADELHVSQPALTVQIHQLEAALGVRLFDRNKRRVALTEAGKSLLGPLERILLDLEFVLNTSQDLAGIRRGTVTVAALPSIAASLLPRAMRLFGDRFPGVTINVRDLVAGRIAESVRAGEVDFGIGSHLVADQDLQVADFLTDRMSAFFPAGHPLSAKRPLSLRDVAAFPLVLTSRDSSVRSLVDRALAKDGLPITLAAQASYMSTVVGMVRAGLGVAILPESAVDCAGCSGIEVAPIDGAGLMRSIGIVSKSGRALSPAAARFADVIRQVAGQSLSYFRPVEENPVC